jgi:hypothetical protein
VLALAAVACTSDGLDDGDSPDVVLEIEALNNDAVTAQQQQQGAGGSGVCTLQINDWTGTARNAPKSEVAGVGSEPFNDIVLESVTITYEWLDGVAITPDRVVPLGDVIVPVGGTAQFTFAPISFQDVVAPGVQGSTANLTLEFDAHTVEGERIDTVIGRQLFVEVCPTP